MNKVIAVEDNLEPVKKYLTVMGCQVIDVEAAMNRNVDAVVLSGADENLMGIQDVVIDAPIINARGISPEDVWNSILQRSK